MLGLMIVGSKGFCDQIKNKLECGMQRADESGGALHPLSFTYTDEIEDASIVVAEEGAVSGEVDAYVFIEVKRESGRWYAEQSILGKKLGPFPVADISHVLIGMIVMVNDLMYKGKKIVELTRIEQNIGRDISLSDRSFQVFHDVQQRVYEDNESMDGFETKMMYVPYNKVSGDFIATGRIRSKSFVVVGDVTGHGYYAAVYASVLTALVKSYFETCPSFSADIYSLFLYMSKAAYCFHGDANESSGECVLCEIDHGRAVARFCSFGGALISPIVARKNGTVKVVFDKEEPGCFCPRIGDPMGDGSQPSIVEVPYGPGDSVLFYSDGFSEVFSKVGEESPDGTDFCAKDIRYEYGLENMEKCVQHAVSLHGNSPDVIVQAVTQDVAAYGTKGSTEDRFFEAKLDDDALIFCIREKELGG